MTCTAGALDVDRLSGRMAALGRTALRALGATERPVTFVIFDLLDVDAKDLTGWPLPGRKRLLDRPSWDVGGGRELIWPPVQPGS